MNCTESGDFIQPEWLTCHNNRDWSWRADRSLYPMDRICDHRKRPEGQCSAANLKFLFEFIFKLKLRMSDTFEWIFSNVKFWKIYKEKKVSKLILFCKLLSLNLPSIEVLGKSSTGCCIIREAPGSGMAWIQPCYPNNLHFIMHLLHYIMHLKVLI